jgi:hypothetical protein
MLKLPAIVCGVLMVFLAFTHSSWVLGAIGLVLLCLGLFAFGFDFGQAAGNPREERVEDEASEGDDTCRDDSETPSPVAEDARRYADQNRKRADAVSAFYLIDSVDSVDVCHQAFCELTGRRRWNWSDRWFFARVRRIYVSGRHVVNYDHPFTIQWQDRKWNLVLRIHKLGRGRYEAELWLPGLFAASVEDQFGKGQDGKFFCGFMPPLFYD